MAIPWNEKVMNCELAVNQGNKRKALKEQARCQALRAFQNGCGKLSLKMHL